MEKKEGYIARRVYKITLKKFDEFLALVGYRRKEINGIGYILNNYNEQTGFTTFGSRIEVKEESVFGRKGMGSIYFDFGACNLEYRQEIRSNWKTLCLYGKKERNIFLQMYDDRELSKISK